MLDRISDPVAGPGTDLGGHAKVLVAMDSLKGCLTSREASKAVLDAFAPGEAEMVPMSDGGEGFSEIVSGLLGGRVRTISCHDPLGRKVQAAYYLVDGGRTAVVETAAASGLCLLGEEERDPLRASSFGTGELIADALGQGVGEVWLGLGGSATCDAGIGLLQALGVRFFSEGGVVENGCGVLEHIHGIDLSSLDKSPRRCKLRCFYDVDVPFCGPCGAARMFSPQKGADPQTVEALDEWMLEVGAAYSKVLGKDISGIAGAGAAGGIGGALGAVLGASMERGIRHVLELSGFGEKLQGCGLVITGEGRSDLQTLEGKVPMGVLEHVRSCEGASSGRTRVVILSGQVKDRERLLAAGFDDAIQVTPDGVPLAQALDPRFAAARLREVARECRRTLGLDCS